MAKSIIDVLGNEQYQLLLVEVFESYIKKCKGIANRPMQGYGKVSEREKKEQWAIKADAAEELLSNIMNELV